MLFHVKIAGKPRVIIPIPNLRNKFRVSFHARSRPVISAHVRESSRRNIANRSVKDALHNISDVQVISPAKARHESKALFFRNLRRFDHRTQRRRIRRHGLFAEYVLTLFNGVGKRTEPKTGDFAQKNDVAAIYHLLISVESGKNAPFDVDPILKLKFKPFRRALRLWHKCVGNCVKLRIGICGQSIDRRPVSTTAASNQSDF